MNGFVKWLALLLLVVGMVATATLYAASAKSDARRAYECAHSHVQRTDKTLEEVRCQLENQRKALTRIESDLRAILREIDPEAPIRLDSLRPYKE